MTKEDIRLEYVDVSNNLRHWNTLRFAELTVYIAITGAMMNVVLGRSTPLPWGFAVLVKAAGILTSVLFLILQERTMTWWYRFVERAAELEEELGFQQYRRRPTGHKITGRVAIRLWFIVIILFWILSFLV